MEAEPVVRGAVHDGDIDMLHGNAVGVPHALEIHVGDLAALQRSGRNRLIGQGRAVVARPLGNPVVRANLAHIADRVIIGMAQEFVLCGLYDLQGIQEDAYTPYTYVRSTDDYEPEAVDPEICPPDIHTTMYITLDAGATHDTGIPCEVSFDKGHLKVSLPEASTNKGTRSAITVYGKVEDKYLYDASDDNQSFKARYHGILENEGKLTIGDKSYDVMAGGFGGFSFIETKEKYHDRLPEYILELSLFVHDEEEGINADISIDLTR